MCCTARPNPAWKISSLLPAAPASSAPTLFYNGLPRNPRRLLNLDKLTYAGNLNNLRAVKPIRATASSREISSIAIFCAALLCARAAPRHRSFRRRKPRRPLHPRPRRFCPHQRQRHLQPAGRNASLLVGACRKPDRASFRFLHVSTDEVYGSLGPDDPAFSETTAYARQQSRTPRPKRLPIIWCAPIITPTDCPF